MSETQRTTLIYRYLDQIQKYRDFLTSLKLSYYEERTLLLLIGQYDIIVCNLRNLNTISF